VQVGATPLAGGPWLEFSSARAPDSPAETEIGSPHLPAAFRWAKQRRPRRAQASNPHAHARAAAAAPRRRRDIPQIEDPKARATACGSARACVRSFPCQVGPA
jgi:hypothetical protein